MADPADNAPARRPNLLVLMTDQQGAHCLSAAGAQHLSTPNLDRLCERGTRFTRAYTAFPLCVPARAAMMSGRYPHQLGINGNQADRQAAEPAHSPASMGHLLQEQGYECAYAGKWHATQPSVRPSDGFDVLAPFGDAGLAELSADWLHRHRGGEEPFALFVSFDDPHTICEYARRQPLPYGEVEPAPIRRTPPLPANFGAQPYEPEVLRFEQEAAAAMYGTLSYSPDEWRRYRHAYARLVERADAHLGVVLDALEAAGLTQSTVVIFTSDHGDGDAAHAWNQKTALFEETCRVPLIIADPRLGDAVGTCDRLVSTGIDLLPTVAAISGAATPAGLTGLDLGPLLRGSDDSDRDHVVVQTRFDRVQSPNTSGRALITGRYKYVVYSWGRYREQLFDLDSDPGETRNLAVEEAFDPVLEGLRQRLLGWCLTNRDTQFVKRLVLPRSADDGVAADIFAIPY